MNVSLMKQTKIETIVHAKDSIILAMMMFDGKFLVLKGDTFTTGLKYNHTSAFQQKAELYQGMIAKSLEKSGIEPVKCSVIGFGTGPLINVMFRIAVDMRKIPL